MSVRGRRGAEPASGGYLASSGCASARVTASRVQCECVGQPNGRRPPHRARCSHYLLIPTWHRHRHRHRGWCDDCILLVIKASAFSVDDKLSAYSLQSLLRQIWYIISIGTVCANLRSQISWVTGCLVTFWKCFLGLFLRSRKTYLAI